MIVDVRTYNIVPRKMKTYLKLFEQYALPILRHHIGEPLGYFVVEHGPLHQVVHLWGYESLADLEQKRTARDPWPFATCLCAELDVADAGHPEFE